MRAPWKRAAVLTLAAGGLCFLPLVAGCNNDIDKSDESISQDIETASQKLAEGNAKEALPVLQKISGTKGRSEPSQIQSLNMQAEAETIAADKLIQQLADARADVLQSLMGIDLVGSQIFMNNTAAAGAKALDPAKSVEAVNQLATAASQGADNGMWFAKEGAPIPAVEGAKKRIADLEKQIAELVGQRNDLNAKRNAALKQAETLGRQAETTKGKDSTGFAIQSFNQRKEASDAEAQIDGINAQINPLQQDLTLTQEQQKLLESAVAGFQKQSESLQQHWKDIQDAIGKQTASSQALLSGGGDQGGATPPPATQPGETQPSGPAPQLLPPLAVQAQKLKDAVQRVQDLRNQATNLLNSAYGHYEEARKVAQKYTEKLRKERGAAANLPEKRAWDELISLADPSSFRLREAAVQGRLSRLYADEAAELAERARLAKLLNEWIKQSGVTPPPAVAAAAPAPADVPADLKQKLSAVADQTAKADADFGAASDQLKEWDAKADSVPLDGQQQLATTRALVAYRWADMLLNEIIEGPAQPDRAQFNQGLAHVARMAHFYDWAQFDLQNGQQQSADQRLKVAIAERDKARENAAAVLPPVLPPEIAPPPGPTSQPTTEPTTQPAEGAAPTTEGAAPSTEPAAPTTEPAAPDQTAPQPQPPATQPSDAAAPAPEPAPDASSGATTQPDVRRRRRGAAQPSGG